MALWFDLKVNAEHIGTIEIRRRTPHDLTDSDIAGLWFMYDVRRDDRLIGQVRHCYGHGAWSLLALATRLVALEAEGSENKRNTPPGVRHTPGDPVMAVDDLATWLRAVWDARERELDDDERVALAASAGGRWRYSDGDSVGAWTLYDDDWEIAGLKTYRHETYDYAARMPRVRHPRATSMPTRTERTSPAGIRRGYCARWPPSGPRSTPSGGCWTCIRTQACSARRNRASRVQRTRDRAPRCGCSPCRTPGVRATARSGVPRRTVGRPPGTGSRGATSQEGVDNIGDQFHAGRRNMIEAFVVISDLARRAGVDEDRISEAHGQFFDGNVDVKDAFGVAAFWAGVRPGLPN